MSDFSTASSENGQVHHKAVSILHSINTTLGKIETGLLCLIIAMMLGLAVLKIVLRYATHQH